MLEGMDRTYVAVLIALLVIALQSSFPQPARAEEPPQPRLVNTGGSPQPHLTLTLRYADDLMLGTEGTHAVQRVQIPAPPVKRECTPRYMAGPAVGMVVGPVAMVGGIFMIGAGIPIEFFGVEDEKTKRDRGLQAGGGLLMAAGLGTFLYSIGKLVVNGRERRRVCDHRPS